MHRAPSVCVTANNAAAAAAAVVATAACDGTPASSTMQLNLYYLFDFRLKYRAVLILIFRRIIPPTATLTTSQFSTVWQIITA